MGIDKSEVISEELSCDRTKLTKAMRWQIAKWLAEDHLPAINSMQTPVCPRQSIYSKYIKRLIDILVALLALVITLPINILLGIITFFDVGKPIFFKQKRLGLHGETFEIIKFRNMKNTTDERGELLPPSERVTRWGKFVRKSSLDELLNFWSILKGDMSIIGPRPLLPEHYSRFSDRHKARFFVRPGLECPPREKLDHVWTWQEQFENDVWYVEHVSFKTDLHMFIRLIQFALDRKSTTARANVKRGIFMGYDKNGIAINLNEVPDKYIKRAFMEIDSNVKVSI